MRKGDGGWAAVIILVLAGAIGASVVGGRGEPTGPRSTWVAGETSGRPGAAPGEVGAARPVPTTREVQAAQPPSASAPSRPTDAVTPPRQAPPPAREALPADDPSDSVWYTDDSRDAHGLAPTSALNQPAFDLLLVEWARASQAVDDGPRAYTTAMTIAGTPRDDGYYVSYGEFHSDVPGETCQLYHVLRPGQTAYANAFCGDIDAGTRRSVGHVRGSSVTASRTWRGTTLVATFDAAALPRLVEDGGGMLWELSAFTCTAFSGPLGCGFHETVDHVATRLDYRL